MMALFTQYAVAASREAMHDAGIENLNDRQKENVVRVTFTIR
jgi:3-oxoacyl-(acyl-carrier-protein) synthase